MNKAVPALELDGIRRTYGAVVAVDDLSLTLAKGEFLTLLGPSGSGKTSTLRLIGGFERPIAGVIRINGERVDHLPPYARDTATIFQSGALFPHKTVAENIAYGLRMRGVSKADIGRRVAEALDIVRLSGFESRYPAQLSGGQKQRVALARSIAVRPAILLFDEPLSALDLSLRLQLRAEIKRLHDELGFSAIYVTHDQGEAMAMSSRVAVMNKGAIVQIDTPTKIFHEPASEFVFTFIGESCCLPVRKTGGAVKDRNDQAIDMTLARPLGEGDWRLYVRPSRLKIGRAAARSQNRIQGEIAFSEFLGDVWRHHVKAGALELFCDYAGEEKFRTGEPASVGWESEHMSVFR
jgi:ABC-type Fe3+/spermidine/putrescine transport system ATPase subunit